MSKLLDYLRSQSIDFRRSYFERIANHETDNECFHNWFYRLERVYVVR